MVLATSCTAKKNSYSNVKQGIRGTVRWVEGNLMPSPDEPNLGKGKTVQRQLLIYEAVNFSGVEGQAPLFKKINAVLVKEVKSNINGIFACQLPEGVYSVFTLEPNGVLFANSFDGNGFINTIKVEHGRVSEMNIEINYKAAY
jgi:hypothetical protein